MSYLDLSDETYRAVFAANLDRIMRLRGLKNPWVGDRLGVSRQAIHQWRHGGTYPSQLCLEKLCHVLQCSLDDLLKPPYAVNLKNLMEARRFHETFLAARLNMTLPEVREFLDGVVEPSGAVLSHLADILECTENDILEAPDVLTVSAWAKKEDIPITRAIDLFELGLLSGAITTDFGLLVPASIKAPPESKQLVSQTKRAIWGRDAEAKNLFVQNLKVLQGVYKLANVSLAENLDVQPATISHWRSGLRTPEATNLAKIGKIFGRTVDDLTTKRLRRKSPK